MHHLTGLTPKTAEAMSFNVAFLNTAGMSPVPMPGQKRGPGRYGNATLSQQQQQQQKDQHQQQHNRHHANSTSPAETPASTSSHRRLGHSRTSSGSHTSRSSHEMSLQADRPAAAVSGPRRKTASDSPTHHHLPSAFASSVAHPIHRPRHVADGLHGSDVSNCPCSLRPRLSDECPAVTAPALLTVPFYR